MCSLKRFDPPGKKAELLLAEVKRYVRVMRDKCLAGYVKKVEHVQPEIKNLFWQNTRSLLRQSEECEMVHERTYFFTAENATRIADIKGKTDHAIKVKNSSFSTVTIADKAICLNMDDSAVSQAVTQVEYEVRQIASTLGYMPIEYVGLLQNGPMWIAILRRVVKGQVRWSHVRTRPAFQISKSSQDTVTKIDDESCTEIARLIEHAYCTADNITEAILNPEKRPMNMVHSVNECKPLYDEDDDEDKDDEDNADGNPDNFAVPGKLGGVVAARIADQRGRRRQKAIENVFSLDSEKLCVTDTAGSTSSSQSDDEYYVLPLSLANVAWHAASVFWVACRHEYLLADMYDSIGKKKYKNLNCVTDIFSSSLSSDLQYLLYPPLDPSEHTVLGVTFLTVLVKAFK